MIGLLLLAIVAIYIAFAVFVVTRAKQRRTRVILSVVMVLLPFVERSIATIRFEWLCRTEHGVHSLMPVREIETLELDSVLAGYGPEFLAHLPALDRVVEGRTDGRFYVIRRGPDGAPVVSVEDSAAADYIIMERHDDFDWLNIQHVTVTVTDKTSGAVLAMGRDFSYWGGMLVRILSGDHRRGARVASYSCGRVPRPVEVLDAAQLRHPSSFTGETIQ